MGRGSPHTHFTKGEKIFIQLKPDGSLVRRFVERRRAAVVVEKEEGGEREHIPISIIKSIGFYRKSS